MLERGRIVLFDGVIVGFETPEGYSGKALYVQGSIDDESTGFYLIVPEEKHSEYLRLGVGQMISGRGRVLGLEPIVLELVEEG